MRNLLRSSILLLLVVILVSGCASGSWKKYWETPFDFDWNKPSWKWIPENTALLATDFVLTGLDYGQTKYIARHPDKYYEKNTILGKHPSESSVNTYFPLYFIAKNAITVALPNPYRLIWQGALVGADSYYVIHNKGMGIGFAW
jgi:hypothetical protein